MFRRWIDQGHGRLVVGGKLLKELSQNGRFRAWLQQAFLSGRAKKVTDVDVDREAESLMAKASCQSNDEHVLALARVSGARLLYSRDEALRKDFCGCAGRTATRASRPLLRGLPGLVRAAGGR